MIKFDDLTVKIQTLTTLNSITIIDIMMILKSIHLIAVRVKTRFLSNEIFSIGLNFFEIYNGQFFKFKFQISTVKNIFKIFLDGFYFRYDIETRSVMSENFM